MVFAARPGPMHTARSGPMSSSHVESPVLSAPFRCRCGGPMVPCIDGISRCAAAPLPFRARVLLAAMAAVTVLAAVGVL